MKRVTGAAPRKRVPRAEREGLILDAAEEVFGRVGFSRAAMDEIAKGSGVTKALLYQYFGSKEGLYSAFFERARGRLFDSLEERVATSPPGLPRLHAAVEGYFAFLDEHRSKRYLIYDEVSTGTADAMRLLNSKAIGRMLHEAIPVELDEVDIELLAQALVGAGEQVGRWWLDGAEIDRGEVVARFDAIATALIAGAIRRSGHERMAAEMIAYAFPGPQERGR